MTSFLFEEWMKQMYEWVEKSPENQAWQFRRLAKNLKKDCDCAVDAVSLAFQQPLPSEAPQGIRDIFDYHFGNVSEYTPAASYMLSEILSLLSIKTDAYYFPYVLQHRYRLNFDQAHVLLSRLDLEKCIDHGSGIRCCWLTEKGEEKILPLADRQQLREWCQENQTHLCL